MQTPSYTKPVMTATSPRKTDKTVTMDREAFIAFCRAENQKRINTARIVANEQYCLRLIGDDRNDINAYAVVSMNGDVYSFLRGRTVRIGFIGDDGQMIRLDQPELNADEFRIGPWNARLVAMGLSPLVRTKHRDIRTILFFDLPEFVYESEVA